MATTSSRRRVDGVERRCDNLFYAQIDTLVPEAIHFEPASQILGSVIRYELEELRADFEHLQVALQLVFLACA